MTGWYKTGLYVSSGRWGLACRSVRMLNKTKRMFPGLWICMFQVDKWNWWLSISCTKWKESETPRSCPELPQSPLHKLLFCPLPGTTLMAEWSMIQVWFQHSNECNLSSNCSQHHTSSLNVQHNLFWRVCSENHQSFPLLLRSSLPATRAFDTQQYSLSSHWLKASFWHATVLVIVWLAEAAGMIGSAEPFIILCQSQWHKSLKARAAWGINQK